MKRPSLKKFFLLAILAASLSSFLFLQERSQFLRDSFGQEEAVCVEEVDASSSDVMLPSVVLIRTLAETGRRLLSVRF